MLRKTFYAKTAAAVLFGTLTVGTLQVQAQQLTYPTRNITVVIPKNPGGGTDTSTRLTLEYAKKYLPQGIIFVPENKPSGNGVTGLVEVAGAKPDGHTLVMTTVELAMFPHQGKSPVTYENFTALYAPIADPCALVVRADSPYKTLKDFIAAAKEQPGKIQVANSGTGAIYDLATINIEQQLGVKVKHIPYNEGIGPAIAALVGGHVDAVITTPGTAKAQVDAGVLSVIGVMDSKRFELFPDAPTFKEALGTDTVTEMRAWAALAGPAKLPDNVRNELVAMFTAVAADPEFQEAMKKQGIMPGAILGDDAANMLKQDHELYAKLIAEAQKAK
ncbi:MAG: tripartite tricarboxylate transporter substrate binding protein [Methylobacteriaceae bacterium]|jgi:tripartite-type tricarboxylate transporter receptor subunit TctC|nr:tripartite tricarboxylate transporter substrate binding protein [Methylobacteriaceae bacterium]